MKAKIDKKLEALVEKAMKESTLENPSLNFTSNVMSQIDAISHSKVTIYKPLISKWTWMGLVAIIAGFLAYSFFGTSAENSILSSIDLSVLTDNKLTNAFSGLNVSKTIIYSAGLFILMFGFQIPLLKGYFESRLSV